MITNPNPPQLSDEIKFLTLLESLGVTYSVDKPSGPQSPNTITYTILDIVLSSMAHTLLPKKRYFFYIFDGKFLGSLN